MLKKFFISPLLKKGYYASLILFSLLFCYHIVRYYIFQADCDYILGDLNQNIEFTLFLVGLISAITSITQLIANAILKKYLLLALSVIALLSILVLLMLFIQNTLLECFLHGVDLGGLFLSQ